MRCSLAKPDLEFPIRVACLHKSSGLLEQKIAGV